ncbi:MAG: hypothetical protein AB1403_06835 [Candidatus Riflebacteria bacterium]
MGSTRIIVWLLAVLVTGLASGCCTKSSGKKSGLPPSIRETVTKNKLDHRLKESRQADIKQYDELNTSDPRLNEERRRKTEQYRRLEYAHQMLVNSNVEGSLRELERLQLDLRDDPYLEMQTWYLSAMAYHKQGKPSRRKRSMRKMLETMEVLQKDPRFKAAHEDGKMAQDVVKMSISRGGDKFAE